MNYKKKKKKLIRVININIIKNLNIKVNCIKRGGGGTRQTDKDTLILLERTNTYKKYIIGTYLHLHITSIN